MTTTEADVQALYNQHFRLVAYALKGRLANSWSPEDREDFMQEGRIALWQALRDYDPAHGASISTWCVAKIRWAVQDAIRRKLAQDGSRRPTKAFKEAYPDMTFMPGPVIMSIDKLVDVHNAAGDEIYGWEWQGEDDLGFEEVEGALWGEGVLKQLWPCLTEVEQKVLTLRRNRPTMTLREVAGAIQLSPSRVTQIVFNIRKKANRVVQA